MSATSSLLHEREPDPRQSAFDPLVLGSGFSLLLVLILRGVWEWRFVHRFLGDHGWYFQVAERVAAGEMLYRDVGWDYGPLPIYALGVLFEISESLAWQNVLDLLLAGASVCAVFLIARRFLGGRSALWLAGWAALLGPRRGS